MMDSDSENDRLLKPSSVDEVVKLVCAAKADGHQLRIRGVMSGERKTTPGVQDVLLDQMCDVVEYPARDMTITVQAGMPMLELTKILAEENQQLPIDAFADFSSIGSLVSGDISGPRRYGYGTMRDYVIGIEAVDGAGRLFHGGGRVVKNVAGYDLCRLMVGSRGTLGIITQVTFKLKPLPEHSMMRTFRFDDVNDMETALKQLNTSAANPVMLDFTFSSTKSAKQHAASPDNDRKDLPYSLHIGVEGSEESCRWQIEQLCHECKGGEEIQFDGEPGWSVRQHCKAFGYGWKEPSIRCRPSQLVTVAQTLAEKGYSTVGHAGTGILFVIDELKDGKVRGVSEEVVAQHGGTVFEWDVDHPANSQEPLCQRLRSTFDPDSVFANEV